MRFEGKPEIILVLSKNVYEFLIVVGQCLSDLFEGRLHLSYVFLERIQQRVLAGTSILELHPNVTQERFKNYNQ